MAASLAAVLGAAAAWLTVILIFVGVGYALGQKWPTWGGRLPAMGRIVALIQRQSRPVGMAAPSDAAPEDVEAPADGVHETPFPTPPMRTTTVLTAPPPAAVLTPPAPSPSVSAPIAAAHAPTGAWLEDFRAAGWDIVAAPTAPAAAPPAAVPEPAEDVWSAHEVEEGWATAEPLAPVATPHLGPLVPMRHTIPVDRPTVGEGHPNDPALDAFGDPMVDPVRGTRVIPIGPPKLGPEPGAEIVEIDVEMPWTVDEPPAPSGSGPVPALPADPFAARRSAAPGAGPFPPTPADDPFAAKPQTPLDDVDRMLAAGGAATVPPAPAQERAPAVAPKDGSAPAKGTAALATLPGSQLRPGAVSPLAPEPGRARPEAAQAGGAAGRVAEDRADPGAARKPTSAPFAPPPPRERTLSRTEAIEELSAIFGVSYEDACTLLDVGLWGFENHEEWVRAVRAGGRPEAVSQEVFEKVLSVPMRAIQEDLDKLRAKRKATQGLEKMWGVGAPEASALYDAGFTTLAEIREASVDQLARIPGINHSTAFMIKASAHGLAPDQH